MSSDTKRMTVRLDSAEYETVRFWASKIGISENDFVRAEIQRLNQLIDLIGSLSSNISNLEDVTVSGFQSLISLTRGDNYLLDNDD